MAPIGPRRSCRHLRGAVFQARARGPAGRSTRSCRGRLHGPWCRPGCPRSLAWRRPRPAPRRGSCGPGQQHRSPPGSRRLGVACRGVIQRVRRAREHRRPRLEPDTQGAPRDRSQERGPRRPGHDRFSRSQDAARSRDRAAPRMGCDRERKPARGWGVLHVTAAHRDTCRPVQQGVPRPRPLGATLAGGPSGSPRWLDLSP